MMVPWFSSRNISLLLLYQDQQQEQGGGGELRVPPLHAGPDIMLLTNFHNNPLLIFPIIHEICSSLVSGGYCLFYDRGNSAKPW